MARSSIFISYSHKDREWLSRLSAHLGVLEQEGDVGAWSDENLRPGDDWPREIREAMDSAKIAVLLVSANFTSSKFIMQKEVPVLMDRWRSGSLKILPLIVTPCPYGQSILREVEPRPKHRDSVADGSLADQERDLRDLTAEIANLLVPEAAQPPGGRKPVTGPPGQRVVTRPAARHDAYALLDVRLSHREWDRYCVELGFTHSGDSAPPLPLTHFVSFDLPKLIGTRDNVEYARRLRNLLFAEPSHRELLRAAQDSASALDVPLQLRMSISACARELHWLRWELLIQGGPGENDLSFESTCLARYAAADARSWRDIQHRPKRPLRALLVAGLTDWFKPSVRSTDAGDPGIEKCARAESILEASGLATARTLGYLNGDAFRSELRATAPDILYLCVDLPQTDESIELGTVGVEWWASRLVNLPIAEAFRDIETPPRMVILCPVVRGGRPEAAESHSTWFSILREAYELAQSGVLGVLTLQAVLDDSTWDAFFKAFLDNLAPNGRMDHALHAARAALKTSGRPWVPVLISCLRTPRIWYEPRFTEGTPVDKTWDTLLLKIRNGECTPMIGPGLNSTIARLRTEIALAWAESYQYPMAFHERISLPQVAQYVASMYKEDFVYSHYEQKIREIMLRRYGARIDSEHRKLPLDRFLTEVGKTILGRRDDEPHKILADLPFRLYVTASLNSFLSDALRRSGKAPQEVVLGLGEPAGVRLRSEPSPEQPLVYHLFGHFGRLRETVLTEDNYFDFLIHFWKDKESIPRMVRAALINTSLIFLGFRMHHWDFRVLFRSLLSQEGAKRRSRHMHVAVQIDPDDDQVVDPERARDYLENYFSDFAEADINVYWGSAEDFLQELKRRWDGFGG